MEGEMDLQVQEHPSTSSRPRSLSSEQKDMEAHQDCYCDCDCRDHPKTSPPSRSQGSKEKEVGARRERDRRPEQSVDRFFKQLKIGDCAVILVRLREFRTVQDVKAVVGWIQKLLGDRVVVYTQFGLGEVDKFAVLEACPRPVDHIYLDRLKKTAMRLMRAESLEDLWIMEEVFKGSLDLWKEREHRQLSGEVLRPLPTLPASTNRVARPICNQQFQAPSVPAQVANNGDLIQHAGFDQSIQGGAMLQPVMPTPGYYYNLGFVTTVSQFYPAQMMPMILQHSSF